MDKKELKKITTAVYEEYGFIKKGKYYYLDLEDVVICSGFATLHGITYLAFNFSVKAVNSEEERLSNNMFDAQRVITKKKYALRSGQHRTMRASYASCCTTILIHTERML